MSQRISILVALEGADEGLKRALTSAERGLSARRGTGGARGRTGGAPGKRQRCRFPSAGRAGPPRAPVWLGADPGQVGAVSARDGELVLNTLPGGGTLKARGADATLAVGQNVFVRNGVVEGPAPALPVVVIAV